MKGLILRSIEQESQLEIIYMNEKGQISQRIIKVLEMNDTYIKAYCYLRRAKRIFKIDNLLSAGTVKPKSLNKGA